MSAWKSSSALSPNKVMTLGSKNESGIEPFPTGSVATNLTSPYTTQPAGSPGSVRSSWWSLLWKESMMIWWRRSVLIVRLPLPSPPAAGRTQLGNEWDEVSSKGHIERRVRGKLVPLGGPFEKDLNDVLYCMGTKWWSLCERNWERITKNCSITWDILEWDEHWLKRERFFVLEYWMKKIFFSIKIKHSKSRKGWF